MIAALRTESWTARVPKAAAQLVIAAWALRMVEAPMRWLELPAAMSGMFLITGAIFALTASMLAVVAIHRAEHRALAAIVLIASAWWFAPEDWWVPAWTACGERVAGWTGR